MYYINIYCRGVHLKDLISVQIKDHEFERCRLISCRKILHLAEALSHFISFNRTPHNFPDANIDLIHTLKVFNLFHVFF